MRVYRGSIEGSFEGLSGFYWGSIGVLLRVYWGSSGVLLRVYWGSIERSIVVLLVGLLWLLERSVVYLGSIVVLFKVYGSNGCY